MLSSADQLLPQLTQCRHIKHIPGGVLCKNTVLQNDSYEILDNGVVLLMREISLKVICEKVKFSNCEF